MEQNLKDSFYEVNEILKQLPDNLLKKIPNNFIKIIQENMSLNYNKKNINLNNINELKKETIIILGLIYRDFIATKEEQQKLLKKEQEINSQINNYDDIFKNKKSNENILINNENISLIIYKEKWYKKLLNLFKIKKME